MDRRNKLLKISYIASLIAGTLLLVPAIGTIAMSSTGVSIPRSARIGQIIGASLLILFAVPSILAFFFRAKPRGSRLLKIAGFLFAGSGLLFPLMLGVSLPFPVAILCLALLGIWILSLTLRVPHLESQ